MHIRNNRIRTFLHLLKFRVIQQNILVFSAYESRTESMQIAAVDVKWEMAETAYWTSLVSTIVFHLYVYILDRPKLLDAGQTAIPCIDNITKCRHIVRYVPLATNTQNDVSASSWRDVALHKWIVNYKVDARRPHSCNCLQRRKYILFQSNSNACVRESGECCWKWLCKMAISRDNVGAKQKAIDRSSFIIIYHFILIYS